MDYFLAFSTPPSTYGSGAGTKIEKISELFSPFMQIFFTFEVNNFAGKSSRNSAN